MGLRRELTWVAAAQYSTFLLPLLSTPWLARGLGVEAYGIYALLISYAAIAASAVEFGTTSVAITMSVNSTGSLKRRQEIYSSVFTIRLVVAVFLALLAAIILVFLGQKKWYFLALGLVPAILMPVFSTTWYLQIIGRSEIAAVSIFFSRLCTLPLVALFVRSPDDLLLSVILTTVPGLISAIFIWWGSRRLGMSGYKWSGLNSKAVMINSAQIYLSSLCMQVYNNLSQAISASMVGGVFFSCYMAADKLIKLINPILAPLSMVLIAKMSIASSDKYIKLIRVLLVYFLISVFFSTGMYFLGARIGLILFGPGFELAYNFIQFSWALPIMVGLNQALNTNGLLAAGEMKKSLLVNLLGALVVLAGSFPVIKLWGIYGAMALSISAEIIMFIAFFFIILKIYSSECESLA